MPTLPLPAPWFPHLSLLQSKVLGTWDGAAGPGLQETLLENENRCSRLAVV